MLLGLALSAVGHVLAGDRPRVALFWDRLDARFSLAGVRTPASAAGGVLLATGASLVLVGLLS